MTDHDFRTAVGYELRRLGLDPTDPPALATAADTRDEFLANLRALPAGTSWRDVFPDLPSDWQGWDAPPTYRPLGPYDYPALPTGPAVHVSWPDRAGHLARLDALVTAARATGHAVHGAGHIEITNPAWPTMDAYVVLARGTDEAALGAFCEWLDTQPGVRLAAIPRVGHEAYAA